MARQKYAVRPSDKLFADDQRDLFEKSYEERLQEEKNQPVECLGMTFENAEKRREYFLEKLREKLKDPEFRKIEGFPIGEDEDILALSDPPYYTACPNPFIEDFIKQYGKPYDPETDDYRREPFAADVSEGKYDPLYRMHPYHTKVPHKAIMRYILHYTEPGDVVFDGFCGTGMTGVAAQLCDDPSTLAALGYTPKSDDELFDENGQNIGRKGCRKAILNDLSPAATLIAAGYNLTRCPESFSKFAAELLKKFNREYGWMYQTTDPKSGDVCDIDFTVWSEVFSCPHCSGELEFWTLAYDTSSGKIVENPTCPHCSAEVSKRDLVSRTTKYYNKAVGATRTKQILEPIEIRYRHRGAKKKKLPDEKDLQVLAKIEQNFLRYDGKGEVPSQIHSYLSSNFKELRNLAKDAPAFKAKGKDRWYVPDPNKAGDLEKLRERALMREFEEYRESKQKCLKVFRLEAVRAGFKKAWQERDYATTTIAVVRKIQEKILQEDPKLLVWYNHAVTRTGEE